MTTVESIYQNILLKLKNDQRPYLVLTSEEVSSLLTLLECSSDISEQKKILCIFQYAKPQSCVTSEFFLQFLEKNIQRAKEEILVDSLIVTQNNIIDYFQNRGEGVPPKYLELLNACLHFSNSQIVHWALRLIAHLGREKKYFEQQIKDIYPSFWAMIFSSQKRENAKLIHYINNAMKGSPWNPR